jgi:general secretion pathway protein E
MDRVRELAVRSGLEFLDTVDPSQLDATLVQGLAVEWARSHAMLPIRRGQELCLLLADPFQVNDQQYIELLVGSHLKPVLASRELILKSIEVCYFSKHDTPMQFMETLAAAPHVDSPGARETDDLLNVAGQAPVTQLVNLILLEAVKRRASDIHFEPMTDRFRVRYRVDGVLYEQTSPPKHMENALVSRLKVMAQMDIAERRLPQDGVARVRVGEREIDVRVSTVPISEGERVVLRLLDRDSALLPLDVLGMSPRMLQRMEVLLSSPNGMIIVSGPTGSGKTTTLYAALARLDSSRRNILTIEDPIEYQLPNIGQIQVKPKIGLTFADGLRHILRQDPDVILVGEIRDAETAEIAARASLTGHLVFATVHTNDAPSVALRLIDMGVEPYLLASSLRGVIAQRLARRLCTHCSVERAMDDSDLIRLGPQGSALKGRTVRDAGPGCPFCLEGYRGRVGFFELLVADESVRDAVREGGTNAQNIRAIAHKAGMTDMIEDGLEKVQAGSTSVSEFLAILKPVLTESMH